MENENQQKDKNEKKRKRDDLSPEENKKNDEKQPHTQKKRKRSKNRKKFNNYTHYSIKEIGNNSIALKNFSNALKHNVVNVETSSIGNMNKLFFDKWKDDRFFLNDRTPFSLLDNLYQGHGHTFRYDSYKEPEETYFEWVCFV